MDAIHDYAQFLRKFLKPVRPLRVVFDSSNGTTGLVLKELFKAKSPIHPILINYVPDGTFPAHGPNPWNEKTLAALGRRVVKEKADCGVVFDADGDRVFFVDDKGRAVSADHTAIVIGMALKGPVVLDLRMGYGAREWFTAKKRKVVDSRVGHFFIKKLMRAKHISYAAELSGHYYFKDFFYCDSGILAAIHFLNNFPVACRVSRVARLSDWIDGQPKYWQSGEVNFEVSDKELVMRRIESHYKRSAKAISKLDGLKMEFDDFWFNVRPSNTEDLLRLNLEAKKKEVFDTEMGVIDKLIKSVL